MESKSLFPNTYPSVVSTPSYRHEGTKGPFAHEGLKKSLEMVVSKPKSIPKSSVLENMFSDKSKTLKASVNAILEEIQLRQELYATHLKQMNNEISSQNTELMNLETFRTTHPVNPAEELDEACTKIKSNVLELEKEKRQGGLECWRDLMFLKKYLMVSLKDYWELARKRSVLEGNNYIPIQTQLNHGSGERYRKPL